MNGNVKVLSHFNVTRDDPRTLKNRPEAVIWVCIMMPGLT